ncbi:hypothetical protein [Streptomyces chilikensis]|uniref:Uncharacterized protein n=1 Tax=Streptomyces chilikensis TaxID=1194079 RepID=A0ABV3EHN0_9ACTN|nr:hypothetical protein [Streptomyces chilikensis]
MSAVTTPAASPASAVSTAARAVAVDTAAPGLVAVEHLVHQVDSALAGLLVEDGGREHVLAGHVLAEHVVSTHVARAPVGRFVAVVSWRGGPEPERVRERLLSSVPGLLPVDGVLVRDPSLAPGALAAAGEALRRSSGRLARYRGRRLVERRTTPGEAVAGSCLDAVEGLAGVEVSPDAVLDATGFARPTWKDGRCTLLVQRAGGDVLVPFEVRDQLACCSAH